MTILLDLDGTALLEDDKGNTIEHPRLRELFKKHSVTLFSARRDIEQFGEKWGVPVIWKGDNTFPEADVMIDDQEYSRSYAKVKEYFSSIDSFIEKYGNNK